MLIQTPFFKVLRDKVCDYGGLLNAHLHIDRSGTLEATEKILKKQDFSSSLSSISLAQKHSLIPLIHSSECYNQEILYKRVEEYLEMMIQCGTKRADTLVDCTSDSVSLTALETLKKLKEKYKSKIIFNVGAYTPLGFKDSEPERWEIFKEAAGFADFLGSLPERDDSNDYPDHIGFDENCYRMLELANQTHKQLHIHLDQKNCPDESQTEKFIEIAKKVGLKKAIDEPQFWLIHVISPSTYSDDRFSKLIQNISKLNLGVICCPSAAISMRQLRSYATPTYNSIARVLEMLAAGIHLRLGSDNICDITSPAGTVDLIDEIFVLANAIRFYNVDILAKLGSGIKLNTSDINLIRDHLEENKKEIELIKKKYSSTNNF